MRTIRELLQLMLEHKEEFTWDSGLCGWANSLCYERYIFFDEYKCLLSYIEQNKPLHYRLFRKFFSAYYWKSGKIEPRIRWIKKHIKLNS